MTFSWIAAVITLLVGPSTFVVWSRIVYRKRDTYHWPLGVLDGFGDTVLLPTFNGFAIGLGLEYSLWRLAVSLVAAGAFSIWFYHMSEHTSPNWSKDENSHLNLGGWWHFLFLIAQSWFVGYALLAHPGALVLWIALTVFMAAGAYYLWVQVPKRNARQSAEKTRA